MKKLLYKGIEFDDFQLYNGEPERYGDCNSESLDGFEGAEVYICPCCVKKYGLYKEAETTEEQNNSCIEDMIEEPEHYDHPICGVKGCNNGNSHDGWLDIKECQLVENSL